VEQSSKAGVHVADDGDGGGVGGGAVDSRSLRCSWRRIDPESAAECLQAAADTQIESQRQRVCSLACSLGW